MSAFLRRLQGRPSCLRQRYAPTTRYSYTALRCFSSDWGLPKQHIEKIPVTILTGFLGAGKTTLLNNILTKNHGKKLAVIENEFGSIGIDDELVKERFQVDEDIFYMNNGCLCCSVNADFSVILSKLFQLHMQDRLDGIVVETTGMANPVPIIQTFFQAPQVEFTSLDAIITVVDAKHAMRHLKEGRKEGVLNETIEQIAFADRLLLNKTDLVDQEELVAVQTAVQSINPLADIVRTQYSDAPMEQLLNVQAFDLDRIGEKLAASPQAPLPSSPSPPPPSSPSSSPSSSSSSSSSASSASLSSSSSEGRTDTFDDTNRGSTDVDENSNDPLSHTHQHSHHSHPHPHHHHHHLPHDVKIGSVSLERKGAMDTAKIDAWLGNVLNAQADDIYRMKAILTYDGSHAHAPAEWQGKDMKVVCQSVHAMIQGDTLGTLEENEEKHNKIVFIGKNLDEEELRRGFEACLI